MEQSTYKNFLSEKINHLKELQQENREQLDKLYITIGRTIAETGGLSAFPALRDKYSLLIERDISLSDDIKQAEDSVYQIEITEKLSCIKCGFINNRGAEFCQKCGTKLGIHSVRTCSKCGAINSDSFRFCADCGSPLGDIPVIAQPIKIDIFSCPSCGREASPDKKFCMFCGTRLNIEAPATVIPIHTPSELESSKPVMVEAVKQDTPVTAEKKPDDKPKKLLTCLTCGKSAPEGQKFCMNCGARFSISVSASSENIPIQEEKSVISSELIASKPIESENIATLIPEDVLPISEPPISEDKELEKVADTPALKTCPVCGATMPEGQSVCKVCGTDFNEAPETFTKKTSRLKSRKKTSSKNSSANDEKKTVPAKPSDTADHSSSKASVTSTASAAPGIIKEDSPIVDSVISNTVTDKPPVAISSQNDFQSGLDTIITRKESFSGDTESDISSVESSQSEKKDSVTVASEKSSSILDTFIFNMNPAQADSKKQEQTLNTILTSPASVPSSNITVLNVSDNSISDPISEPVDENRCPECGAVCKPGRSFCVMCGTKLEKN